MPAITRLALVVAMLASGAVLMAHAAPSLHAIEAAFGLYPGRKFVSPQIGATIEYLRIEPRAHGEYAIIVRKLD